MTREDLIARVEGATDWIAYEQERPPAAGVYEWRMPSRACPGLVIGCFAHYRQRGAGYEDVLSPSFDYWNGYRVIVPTGLQWRANPCAPAIKTHEEPLSFVEGVELDPCPFCKRIPTLKARQRVSSGGSVVNPCPADLNYWQAQCCGWAAYPSFGDPRGLATTRAALLRSLPEESADA